MVAELRSLEVLSVGALKCHAFGPICEILVSAPEITRYMGFILTPGLPDVFMTDASLDGDGVDKLQGLSDILPPVPVHFAVFSGFPDL